VQAPDGDGREGAIRPALRAVLYLHGGAYISEIAPRHWAVISRMADAGVRVEVPSDGLAPSTPTGRRIPSSPPPSSVGQ
jgi:acetyl esterase/lipase